MEEVTEKIESTDVTHLAMIVFWREEIDGMLRGKLLEAMMPLMFQIKVVRKGAGSMLEAKG